MVYSVHTMQVYYTTYDMKREYDAINPRTHADIMVLSGETNPRHPYWYARVLGIYHMDAVALRKIVKDCFGNQQSTIPSEAMDGTSNDESHEEGASESCMDDDLDEEESEDDLSEEESEGEHDGLEGGEDREEADEELDDLHF
jgi:hypothetical protein